MSDLISRQAAIKAFYIQSDDDGWWVGTAQDAETLLNGLPTIDPVKWIPVSERLPEECKQVLVCDDYQFIYVAEYEVFSDGVGRWSESTELLIIENVTAWMPLPEPWRGQ